MGQCIPSFNPVRDGFDMTGGAVQVVNTDDLTQILGERPFRSAELRNIDKVHRCARGLCHWLALTAQVFSLSANSA